MAYNVLKGSVSNAIASSGADVGLTTSNTSDTASSTATLYTTVAGTSAGDARVQYAVTGTTTWTEGIDNSDSDAYVIAASTALGTTNVMRASTAGEINYPLQPAFFAYLGTTDSNVIGNASNFVLGSGNALTEVFDQGSDFATTGTFTAPVTGRYFFAADFRVGEISAAMTFGRVLFTTSNRSFTLALVNCGAAQTIAASPALYSFSGTIFCDMDAADTCTVAIRLDGGVGDTADVISSNGDTFFAGHLVC